MHWQDDRDEKKRQQWKSRIARERLDLSASVEETLSDESTLRELEMEEFDDFEPEAEEAMLIPPRLSLRSKPLPAIRALPKVRTGHLPLVTKELADSSSTEFPRAVQKKRRSTISNTKVRLQVVPKSGVFEESISVTVPPDETVTNHGLPTVESLRELIVSPLPKVGTAISGSANFEKGQSEVMVANACITLKSVVVVMLIADPGPVVVQYVSLQPGVGFTVHLSAPTQKPTTFNYRICQD
jgi:hypothetical protein